MPLPHDPLAPAINTAHQWLRAVTEALSRLFSTGQLDRLLAELPAPLRRLLTAELLSSTFAAAATDNQGSR
ncbi:DUF2267 domain-containing protein [Nocardia carnea]|uniref:DUF2267 domain-containing protein n=1 Tax=Nocardia carnea TaxID=37328 RepID=A0ABW7TLH1_9NOCA|nr:DUF2267 domain-containing protein [Nocardia carnea]